VSGDAERPSIRVVGGRRMQCKDILDEVFLDAVRRTPGVGGRPDSWRTRWDVQRQLEAVTGWLPERLFLAKASGLIRRKLLRGCPCGCRGDYELPEPLMLEPQVIEPVVFVPCPGASCVSYLYGIDHQHTARPDGERR
jgi:hypothetical protein